MTLALVFGVTLTLGSVVIALRANDRLSRYRRQRTWPKAPATILQSSVAEDIDGDGTSYSATLVYQYVASGKQYTSDQHSQGGEYPVTRATVEAVLQRLPVGAVSEVSVNPDKPSDAILDTGFPKVWEITFRAGLAGTVAGVAIVGYQLMAM